MHRLRFRQIHLDFHTSPAIPKIGARFDKAHWQKTLKTGHVDSITCFAKCHHGWSYHPTEIGKLHPHLEFDLLRAQFDACKEIDVNVPIYISAGVDNVASAEKPEWREVGPDGRFNGWVKDAVQPGFHKMCFNTPYLDYLCKQIEETVRLFPDCDGIFLDIISQGDCCCRWCLEEMAKLGLDPTEKEDRRKITQSSLRKYYERTTAACRVDNPEMPVFHNSGHITRGNREILPFFSHLELESLPTGGWGYDHFPISAKYCKGLEHDFLGMTGKFHTTWGEFGGFKHPNALRYECAAMIAYGSKCSVGDQLHPEGDLDESTYSIIGAAYSEVEAKEAWCDNVESIADIGLLSLAATGSNRDASSLDRKNDQSDTGAGRILLEGQFLFDVLDTEMDFAKYKLLLLPDSINIDDKLKTKIDAYLSSGGKLLISGTSGIEAGNRFLFDVGAELKGESPFQPDYVLPVEGLRPAFCSSPMVMYLKSQRIKVTDGEALGDIFDPYFNRKFPNFCSHQHAPAKPEASGYASGVRKGNILYLAHPVFELYAASGSVAVKDYAVAAIQKLLSDDRSMTTSMPSTARMSLMDQPGENRLVLHLLYANTINRGGPMKMSGGNLVRDTRSVEVIEDLLPLRDTKVSLKTPKAVKRAVLQPQGQEISFSGTDGCIELAIDEFICHQMVELQY